MAESTNAITTREMREHGDLIRKAFSAGRKTVLIAGRRFNVRKQVRVRKLVLGPPLKPEEQITKLLTDRWIVATPVSGQVPVYNVELVPYKNGMARSK
jgi:hypothetical protein